MKSPICIVVLLFVTFCFVVANAGGRYPDGLTPSFIIAGQSNAWGGSNEARVIVSSSPNSFTSRIWKWGSNSFPLQDVYIYPAPITLSTPWPSFVNAWQDNVGKPVKMFMAALGGTCLATDPTDIHCDDYVDDDENEGAGDGNPDADSGPVWDPDGALPGGDRYANMLTKNAANGFGDSLRAVLWFQGECEMSSICDTSPTTGKQADYTAALQAFADAVKRDLGVVTIAAVPSDWTGLPGGTCDTDAPSAGRVAIHDAVIAAVAANSNLYLGPDTDDLEYPDSDCGHVHEVATLGERWYDAIAAAGLAY